MHKLRRSIMVMSSTIVLSVAGMASAQSQNPSELWADFNHYVLIARPDLAAASAQALLDQAKPSDILNIVESSDYRDYSNVFARASRIDEVKDVAKKLDEVIRNEMFSRSRQPKRIKADIESLSGNRREAFNATARLREAGQYASPYLLETLKDNRQARLHPYVMAAMVKIGKPLVYPLSVALKDLDAVPASQVAQVLGEIGYPRALPYLQQLIEDPSTDAEVVLTLQAAYNRIASSARVSQGETAASLFLQLGKAFYSSTTNGEVPSGFDAATNTGIIWRYDLRDGLLSTQVPKEIFGDVLAMHAGINSLKLDKDSSDALNLILMANQRRENNLPANAEDKSYTFPNGADFYTLAAGPQRQRDVLKQAITDGDAELALDMVRALGATAGSNVLIKEGTPMKPLLDALSYPDRRVRYEAAFVFQHARPQKKFQYGHRVVPVLAEAIRPSNIRYAVVVTKNNSLANSLQGILTNDLGYRCITGTSLADVNAQIDATPGVDLIISSLPLGDLESMYKKASDDHRLAATPILALIADGRQTAFDARFDQKSRIYSAIQTEKTSQLKPIVDRVVVATHGKIISDEEAHEYALVALERLHELAANNSKAFNVNEAEPALIAALNDKREGIATLAADVLSLLDSEKAQRAIADAALQSSRATEIRVSLMLSLARSANLYGTLASDIQQGSILNIVKSGEGDLAVAAAKAHGALRLPTSNAVELLAK